MSPGSLPTVSPLTSSLYNVMMNQNNNPTSQANEEISTIFVVGFPDDMQEREFQNMFIFSPGFEAATLKVPSKDQEEEMGLNTTTPSNPPTNLSASAASNVANTNARKQIIGFAKFRTRLEALEAKDILSGRKVDAEKGSVLKAEMAKKNLHTKRGLSSDQQQQTPTTASNTTAFPMAPQAIHPQKRFPGNPASAYEAFYSVPALPSDLLSPNEYPYDFYSDVFSPSTPTAFNDPTFASRAQSFDARSSSASDVLGGGGSGGNANSGGVGMNGAANGGLVSSSSARAPIGFNPGHRFSKGLIDLENDPTHPLSYLSKSTPVGSDRGFAGAALFGSSALTNGLNGAPQQSISSVLDEAQQSTSTNASNNNANRDSQTPQPPTARFGSLSINTNSGGVQQSNTASTTAANGLPSPGLGSPGYRGVNMIPAQNPADQNPPCNTLYVGNLPPNTSEDELKALFSRCIGYKRLSFRNKPNGPMCFVEFEDVACAAQALNDLYGNPLSNSVKGGIRLSYSKNPLGVRQNPTNNNSSSNTTTTNNNSTSNSSTTTTPTNSNIINSINNTTSNVSSNNGIPITMMNNNSNQHNSFGYNPMVGGFSFPDRRESYSFDPQLS